MYEVKDWNEEVMKWLAVGLCLAVVGMAVMPLCPVKHSNASWYLGEVGLLASVPGAAKGDNFARVGLVVSAASMGLALVGLATATGGVGIAIAL
ncbi:hypothetical protein [Archaeoglobus neptunius]|uniref:hypothetical protein n=1 Tax=Archaeoglobus neptunius TaxID=2798580 RepID=UPI001928F5C3|nr:hypothetical protein [Archaeoglobus neptunius]